MIAIEAMSEMGVEFKGGSHHETAILAETAKAVIICLFRRNQLPPEFLLVCLKLLFEWYWGLTNGGLHLKFSENSRQKSFLEDRASSGLIGVFSGTIGGLLGPWGRTGPIPLHLTATEEEQKLPRKGPPGHPGQIPGYPSEEGYVPWLSGKETDTFIPHLRVENGCGFLLTNGSFLLPAELFYLQLTTSAFLLTIGAFFSQA